MRLSHIDDLRWAVPENTQGNNPIEQFVVARLLNGFRGERRQLVPFAAL